MENIKLAFLGSKESCTYNTELTIIVNPLNEISISIEDTDSSHDYNLQEISLTKQTAVRLVRELKKQIGLLESEFPTMQKGNYSILTKEVKKGGNTNG